MAISDVLASIDHDLAKLREARALLLDGSAPVAKKKAGRPKKLVATVKKAAGTKKKAVAAVAAKPAKKKKRNLSPEGRKRIAEAVKRRWAKQKKEDTAAK